MSRFGRSLRIVVVDDQIAHLKALCDTLEWNNYDTVCCTNGEAALARIREDSFDLLLTDLAMPGIDGLALIEAARAVDPYIACIIMTGAGTVDTAVKAMKIGALDYIIKPFKAAVLIPVLERAIEFRQLRQTNAKLESTLREAERVYQEKSAFLSCTSHGLRTRLNNVLGFANTLASGQFPKEEIDQRRFVQCIVQSGRHLLSLVNEILDLTQIESDKVPLMISSVTLDTVLREAYTNVAPLAQARGITLSPPPVSRLELCADRQRLTQILVNLLSNAITQNCERGTVSVSCEELDSYGRVTIKSSGRGLSQAQLSTIFLPFGVTRDEDSGEEGTSLALAVTQRLVVAMRGNIEVESQLGVGTTFRVDLPLQNKVVAKAVNANVGPFDVDRK